MTRKNDDHLFPYPPKSKTPSSQELVNALEVVTKFLSARALTDIDKENFEGTAHRVARMYQEMAWTPEQVVTEVRGVLEKTFPVSANEEPGMIVQGPITLNSMCPHHLMPVRYHAYVGYIPKVGGKVLGLSKLARVPEYLSKRFVLQEQLAKDIADCFYKPSTMPMFGSHSDTNWQGINFSTEGSIATLIGVHGCESCRGVRQDARTLVTERRGAFREETIESRFYQAVNLNKTTHPFGG